MVKRVIIDSTAASPLRVSVSGVDADSAEFNDLIFDGNQSPLRLWGVGYGYAAGFSYNSWIGGKNVNEGSSIPVLNTPTGTTSIFVVQQVQEGSGGNARPPFWQTGTSGQLGGGGGICSSSLFCPISMNSGPPGAPSSPAGGSYVNFMIFKNYQ